MTDSSATVWLRTNTAAQVKIQYRSGLTWTTTDAVSTSADGDYTAKVVLTNLTANTVYFYTVLVNEVSQFSPASPYPQFKTFPPEGTPASFAFVYLTDFCCFGLTSTPTVTPPSVNTFAHAAAEQPDFVFIGGDFDHRNPAGSDYTTAVEQKQEMFKYLYTSRPNWAGFLDLLKKYPVAHQWDDHDSGEDDDSVEYGWYTASRYVLDQYFPVYPLPSPSPPDNSSYGDWQKFTYGDADFFVLDSRSQRSPLSTPEADRSMLDAYNLFPQNRGQLYWLEQGLLASKNAGHTWRFILSPVVFNTTMEKADSWYGYSQEHDDIVAFIKDPGNAIKNVIVLSGDIHAGAIDNGDNAGLPEMAVPAANLKLDQGSPTPELDQSESRFFCFSGGDVARGDWSEGTYPTATPTEPCPGYGLISVVASPSPGYVLLQVKDENGNVKVQYTVTPEP